MKNVLLKVSSQVILTAAFLLVALVSLAQSTSWKGTVSTAWSNASNWTNGVPSATKDAIIGDASFTGTRMPQTSVTSYCKSLTIGGVKAATLKFKQNMIIYGDLTINSNGIADHDKTTTIYGSFVNNGTFQKGGATTIIFAGTASTITGTTVTDLRKIRINSGATLTFLTNFRANTTVNGSLIPSPTKQQTGGSINVNSGGYLKVTGTSYDINYVPDANLKGGSTVEYSAFGNQTVKGNIKYSTLLLTGSGIKSPAQNFNDLYNNQSTWGNVYVYSGVTFDLLTYDMKRSGGGAAGGVLSVANGATFRMGGTVNFPTNFKTVSLGATSIVDYYGNNQTVGAYTYGHLNFLGTSGAVTKTMPSTAFTVAGNFTSSVSTAGSVLFSPGANITFMGNVTIGATTTFSGSSRTYTVYGNWVNNGTFTPVTSTVIFAGTNKTISGAGSISFYNVTVTGVGISTAVTSMVVSGNFAATGVGTFTQSAGTLTMSGAAKTISGNGITLNHYTVSGTITSTATISMGGNMIVSAAGTYTATSGTMTMTGAAKTITNSNTLSYYKIIVSGSITTANNFNVSNSLSVTGSLTASAGTATFTSTSIFSGTANLFNVTLNGTSLQLSSNSVLGIAGTYTIAAGALNTTSTVPNTVHFNATTPKSIAGSTFYNVWFSNTTYTATSGFTANGSFIINSTATFLAGTFTHTIKRDFTNNGVFTAGTSTVQFTGGTDANIYGATTFNILTLNKNANTNLLNLQNNVSAATVNMTTGKMLTGTNTVTITTTRTGNGIILGNILRTHAFATGVAYAFEGPNNTITFSSVSGVTSVLVKVTSAAVGTFPFGGSINRMYDISTPGGGTYNATLRLHYEDVEVNGNDETTMALWQNIASTWTKLGKTANSTTNNYVEQSGITNLVYQWTLSDDLNVLSWNGSVSTDWATPANWTAVAGSPSSIPSATDIALIGYQTYTYAPTVTTAGVAKSIQFFSTMAAALSLSSPGSLTVGGSITGNWSANAIHTINVNSRTLAIGGDLSMSDGTNGHKINISATNGNLNISGNLYQLANTTINITGSANIRVGRDFVNNAGGTFNKGTSTVIYNGSVNQSVAAVNYNNLTVNSSTIASLASAATISGNLTVTTGELDVAAATTVGGNVSIAAGSTLDGGTNTLSVGGNWSNSGTYVPQSGTVTMNGTSTQTISASPFNNLIINKTADASLTGDLAVTGDVTLSSGDLNLNTYNITRSPVGGTLTLGAGTNMLVGGANNFPTTFDTYTLSGTSTVNYNGAVAQSVQGIDYGYLTFTNGGATAKTLMADATVAGDLNINSGATFSGSTYNIDLAGNWTSGGTFTPSTSTVNVTGASKTITGTTAFNNLNVYGSYSSGNINTNGALYTDPAGSLAVTGNVTMSGDLTHSGSLSVSGTVTFSGTAAQNITIANPVATNISTVNFNGTVAPVMTSTEALTFNTVNVNNTGGVTPNTNLTVNTAFNVAAGATFSGSTDAHTFLGSFTNNGTVTSSGTLTFNPSTAQTIQLKGTAFTSSGLVVFSGTAAMSVTGAPTGLGDVLISNTVGVSPTNNWTVTGSFYITGEGVFNAGALSYNVGGDFQGDGVLNGGTSTFTMYSSVGNNLSGSEDITFYNLSITGIITVLDDYNVSHDFTNSGTFDNAAGTMHMTGGLASLIGGPVSYPLAELAVEKSTGVAATLTQSVTGVVNLAVVTGIFNESAYGITESSGLGTLTIAEDATMQIGGTMTLPSFTVYDLDSLSTVEYNGSTQSVSNATNYGNLTISAAGTKTAAGALTIKNDFTLTAGTFTGGSYTHIVDGDWLMTGGGFLTTGTTITFNGGDDQTISSTGAFNNVVINKSIGATTLFSNVTSNGTLTFTLGKVTTGTYEWIVGTNGAVSGASQSTGWVYGKMRRNCTPTNLSRVFYVGGATYYAPVTVTFASITNAGGGITMEAVDGTHPMLAFSSLPWNKNVPRYWTMTNPGSVTFTTFTLAATWNIAESYAGMTTSKLRIGKYYSGNWTYETLSGTSTTTTCAGTSITTRGDFLVGEPCVIAGFEYDTSYYCSSAGTISPSMYPGAVSGTWSATPAGLSLNTTNGDINLGASSAGTYIITNTATGPGGCTNQVNDTITVTTLPTASISYTGSPYCSNNGVAAVTFSGTAGGTYYSDPAVSINMATGTVNPGGSTPGSYTVTYTIAATGGCPQVDATANIAITQAPVIGTIGYGGINHCRSEGTISVTATGDPGGVYSSAAGLSINSSTGAIDLAASTAGTYAVYYTIAAAGGCGQVQASTLVVVSNPNSATISYAGSPYCSSGGTANVTRTGTSGGTYSSTAGLSINSSTGQVTLATSTPGTYTVTYTMGAVGACPAVATTTSITVTAQPSATISYSGTPYCSSAGTATVTFSGTAGGTYSSTAGLSINAASGDINLGASTAGTYTVTYTVAAAGGCAVYTTTTSVTITAQPSATISYSGSPFCKSVATAQSVTRTGTAGGTYSSTAGLSINAATGDITPSTSAAGTYTVTYTVAAAGGCAVYTTTTSVTITATPSATISYAGTPFCKSVATAQAVTQTGTAGGTYSSTAGLSINAATGDITPSTSTAGTYTVTYTVAAAGGCAVFSTTTSVTITTTPSATISYSGSPYCSSGGTASVTQTGTAGGTYTSTAGLSINAATGAVNLGASTAGTYTVTYTVAAAGGCAVFSTTASITVTAQPSATISYAGTPFCSSVATAQAVTQTGTAGGIYSSTAGLTINAATGAITPSTSTAGTYTVTYTVAAAGGCALYTTTTSVTITATPSATISYAGAPFCSSVATAQAVTQTGTAGGTYSSTAGLTINAATGAITPSTSTAGTYTVTYTVAAAGGCALYTTTTSVTITTAPSATISYAGTPFCKSVATGQAVTQTGTAGGTYSSTAGLSINAATGAITPSTSTAGTYTVTYSIAASGGCALYTTTTSVTITATPSATISYAGTPFCTSVATAQSVTQTGTAGGTYSSTAGLSINAATGAITPSTSTVGTYTVTYTVAAAGGCAVFSTTTSVTITAGPSATINYAGSPYCSTGSASVTQTGTAGGTYSSTVGLSINAATGAVNLTASTPGSYTVTYTVAASAGCAQYQTTGGIVINNQGTWTGAVNTDWNNGSNWQCGIVPDNQSNVVISSGLTNYPIMNGITAEINSITLQANTNITVTSSTLQVRGTMSTSGGTITATNGTFELTGTSAQTIPANLFTSNTLKNLTISNTAGASLSGTLNVTTAVSFGNVNNSTFTTGGNLYLKSTSTTDACLADITNGGANSGNSISGDVTVERYNMAGRAFRFLTAPVNSTTTIKANWMEGVNNPNMSTNLNPNPGYGTHISGSGGTTNGFDQTVTMNPSMFTYDNMTQLWSAVPNTAGTFKAGTPYRILIRGDRSIDLNLNNPWPTETVLRAKGPVQTGNVVMAKPGGGGTAGMPVLSTTTGYFSLVGNPYPAAVDWLQLDKTDLANSIYIFDPTISGTNGRGGYVTYNGTLGSNNVIESQIDNNIQSGQAFFVETTGPNPSLTFREPYKTGTHRSVFRPAAVPELRLHLLLPGQDTLNKAADGLGVFYSSSFSDSIGGEDSYKFINQDENIGIVSHSKVLSLEGRKAIRETDTIALKFWQILQSNYKFKITLKNFDASVQGYVEDVYMRSKTPLRSNSITYVPVVFTSDPASKAADRFRIVFKNTAPKRLINIDIAASQKDKGVQVDWSVRNEDDAERYEVERSTDGKTFTTSSTLKAEGTGQYGWFDAEPVNGDNFYRIKAVEKIGLITYTQIVRVDLSNNKGSIVVSPNPVVGKTMNLVMTNLEKGSYKVNLVNSGGQKVFTGRINHPGGTNSKQIKLGGNMPQGAYTLQVQHNETSQEIPILLQ